MDRGIKRSVQRVKNDLLFILLKTTIFLLRLIPFNASVRLGSFLGKCAFDLLPAYRRIVVSNLTLAFGESMDQARARRIGRECYANLGAGMFEIVNFHKIRRRYRDYITGEGYENLSAALEKGRGAVVVTGHCGNWELMAAYFALEGFPVNVIARSVYDPRINGLLTAFRASSGVSSMDRNNLMDMRRAIRALRGNQLLALLIDQDTRVPSVFVDFFGKKANTPVGAAQIAMKYDCPIIPGFCIRKPEGGLHVVIHEPLEVSRSGDQQQDLIENTQRITAAIERHVREYPGQWVWMHRRWKRRPPEEKAQRKQALEPTAGRAGADRLNNARKHA